MRFAVLGVLLVGCSFLAPTPVTGEVVGRSWQRDVIIESFEVTISQSWRANLPRRASRLPVAGEGALPGNDGLLGCVQKRRSKDDPLPSEWCRYRSRHWSEARRVVAAGEGEPQDPEELGDVGNHRVRRLDSFRVQLRWQRGEQAGDHLIELTDPAEYARWIPGSPVAFVLDEADRVLTAEPTVPGRELFR